jgi:hypothetical protein
MKNIASGYILTLLSLPLPASAVLLDCEVSAERVYTCVEIGDSTTAVDTPDGKQSYSEEYRQYIEQAQQQCVYKEPRRRVAGKNTGGAIRVEELKSARADYDRCVSESARELWRRNNPPARP